MLPLKCRLADPTGRICEQCGEPVSPERLSAHQYMNHADCIRFLSNGSEQLSVYRRSPEGLFQCRVCHRRGRDAKKMTVGLQLVFAHLTSELGPGPHLQLSVGSTGQDRAGGPGLD